MLLPHRNEEADLRVQTLFLFESNQIFSVASEKNKKKQKTEPNSTKILSKLTQNPNINCLKLLNLFSGFYKASV